MITPTPKQAAAIKTIVNRIKNGEQVSVLQGVAGSGKTVAQNIILKELGYPKESVIYSSFTGSATKLLKDRGLNAVTLHSLLFNPVPRIRGGFIFKEKPKSRFEKYRLIVVDEFSMMTQPMLEALIRTEVPLLLIGDSEQLPPIGQVNKLINHYDVFLDEPLRQALDNPIVWAANAVRNNQDLKNGEYGILQISNLEEIHNIEINESFNSLCRTNELKYWLNQISIKRNFPQKNDRIIFNKNDFQKKITNGTITHIKAISRPMGKDKNVYYLNVSNDANRNLAMYKAVFQEKAGLGPQTFDLAYAMTVQKAQGQTFDSPGIFYDTSSTKSNFSKKMIYTALTRFTGNYPVYWLRK